MQWACTAPLPYLLRGIREPQPRDLCRSEKHIIVGLLPIMFLASSRIENNFKDYKPAPQQATQINLRYGFGALKVRQGAGSPYLCPLLQSLGIFYLVHLGPLVVILILTFPNKFLEDRNQCLILNS